MKIERLESGDLPALASLFRDLSLFMPAENLDQFSRPRSDGAGREVVTLIMRDAGRVIGTVGWIDLPLRLRAPAGGPLVGRWIVNLYVLSEYRGRGLGKALMDATRAGARYRLLLGGTPFSIPLFDSTGWKPRLALSLHRWARPCVDPRRLPDRFRPLSRGEPPALVSARGPGREGRPIAARRVEAISGRAPWADGRIDAPGDCGVPRDEAHLRFVFGGPMRRYHALYEVAADGERVGYFALAARSERRLVMTSEIVDLDACRGHEASVIAAARAAALACADVARIRIAGDRFVAALASLPWGGAGRPDLPLRIACDPSDEPHIADAGAWHLTCGDHDQYRARRTSQRWIAGGAQAP